jgi:uncharacterized protein involved in exopolysaccharide biosynthesis
MGMKRMFWRSRSVITEEVENGTQVGIQTKRPRRRMKVILTCALAGTLGGFLISYVFPAQYVSQSMVLVEGQIVPDTYVQPVITSDFTQRIQTLSQVVLAPSRLRPVVHSLAVVKPDEERKLIETIQNNMVIEPVITAMSAAAQADVSAARKEASATDERVPGFTVSYTDSNALRAQKICNALTLLIVDENLRSRADVVQSITEFLNRELEEAKRTLDEQDAKIAAFKKQYMGKLPTDTRGAMSPSIEEQYKLLTRDNDNNEAVYKDLLAKKFAAKLSADMENQQLGEQVHVIAAAGLPEVPSFQTGRCLLFGGWARVSCLGSVAPYGPFGRPRPSLKPLFFTATQQCHPKGWPAILSNWRNIPIKLTMRDGCPRRCIWGVSQGNETTPERLHTVRTAVPLPTLSPSGVQKGS